MIDYLGPYELRGELGRGAMAVVWRAWDTKLEREVAIKEPMVPPGTDQVTAADLAARFVREGKAAAALNHPGIVTIYAADVYDGRPAIVMELIEGETLSGLLDRGPLATSSTLAVLDQLLDAAGYAHSRGVVHRDIKPDNIFITTEGRVKLADFGIAHMGTSSALTQAGTVMGTPGYMSPEQVTGQAVDSRADIFAIGVIGYEMLTGSNPFGATEGVASTTVMYRIVHEPMPLLPAQVSAGLPANLSALLAAATAKDPAARIADAASFRAALHGGPLSVGTVTPGGYIPAATMPVPKAPGNMNWTPYLIVGAIAIVAVGLFVVFGGGGTVGTSTSAVAGSVATETPKAPEPTQSAPDAGQATAEYLSTTYSQIGSISKSISTLAKRFNVQAQQGASDALLADCESLVQEIQTATDDLQGREADSGLSSVKSVQLRLLGYCLTRANALVDGCRASQNYGDYRSAVAAGHVPKQKFDALYPQGRP